MTFSSQLQVGSVVHCTSIIQSGLMNDGESLNFLLDALSCQKEFWITVIRQQENYLEVNLMFVDKSMEKIWLKLETIDQLIKEKKLKCTLEQQIFKKPFWSSLFEDLVNSILRFWKDVF